MKVFGIGMQKTGTTSLCTALKVLGYRVEHFIPDMIAHRWYEFGCPYRETIHFDASRIFEIAKSYDALADNPLPLPEVYHVLDDQFPDAKFVLTTRDTSSWLNSVKQHINLPDYHKQLDYRINYWKDYDPISNMVFTCDKLGLLEYIYQVPYKHMNDEVLTRRFEDHYYGVIKHCQDRKDKLLEFSLEDGDGWKELCDFLGIAAPGRLGVNYKFPHSRKTQKSFRKALRMYRKFRYGY